MPLPTDMEAKLLRQIVLAGMADLKEDQDKAKWKYALEVRYEHHQKWRNLCSCILRAFYGKSVRIRWFIKRCTKRIRCMRGVTTIEPE
ncbi:uncharacterized protein LOC112456070 isoform X4 [Temnothorax curvispinosus]|uniref:Uncharacterized protein LOC112456070 isoform X4 n=1 Tax=Temnothorax curvispinosus TaxID=300111 RepID=A0A6J1PZG3_9HYME|nr:uncharacterized protein LOC112456070 isoform X4 [Temnothorax curvispinosus]XP_024874136.1 uncharacterized protein LOC112456070 isoform X4 [Temnothorax curvispinosus]